MSDEVLNIVIKVSIGLFTAAVTALWNSIKAKLSAKTREKVEKIATVVEQLYNGCSSADKLNAFKEICSAKKINVVKAVEYLEQHIIPLSKELNTYKAEEVPKVDKNKAEVTN